MGKWFGLILEAKLYMAIARLYILYCAKSSPFRFKATLGFINTSVGRSGVVLGRAFSGSSLRVRRAIPLGSESFNTFS